MRRAWEGLTGELFGDKKLYMEDFCKEEVSLLSQLRILIFDKYQTKDPIKALKLAWKGIDS